MELLDAQKKTFFLCVLFLFILLDSLVNYFANTLVSATYPINALTCVAFIIYFMVNHKFFLKYLPSQSVLFMLGLILTGFLLGLHHNYYSFTGKLFKSFSALVSLLIGYYAFRQINNERYLSIVFLVAGSIYTLVCFIAVLRVAPGLFPVIDALWADGWTLVSRPEVTTDQNFQIYYLFFLCFILFFSVTNITRVLVLLGSVLALYSLSQLQTRSGVLLYLAAFLLSVYGAARLNFIKPVYIFLAAGLGLIVIVNKIDAIYGMASYLIDRFVDDDYRNLEGRVKSASYLLELVASPIAWFVPQGLGSFERLFGGFPHSNYTAIFLEGGILSFFGFLVLQVFTIVRVGLLSLKYKLDSVTLAALFGAMISLMGSLSLCVPYHEHVYLWVGALIGAEMRLRHIARLRRRQ